MRNVTRRPFRVPPNSSIGRAIRGTDENALTNQTNIFSSREAPEVRIAAATIGIWSNSFEEARSGADNLRPQECVIDREVMKRARGQTISVLRRA
jgi:hypothetical protein